MRNPDNLLNYIDSKFVDDRMHYILIDEVQLVKEFEDAVFNGELNKVLGPVKTQFGYHLIKVVDKHEAGAMPFDSVKGQIMNTLVQQKQNQVQGALEVLHLLRAGADHLFQFINRVLQMASPQ